MSYLVKQHMKHRIQITINANIYLITLINT